MTDYNIRIVVTGDDRASGPLGRVGNALGGIGTVAGGILGANALMGIARGIVNIGSSAIGATAQLQSMELGMATLAAKEIANTENTKRLADATAQGLDTTKVSLMSISDALPQAQEKAKAMMDQLAKIAILSPYQLQYVQGTYQMAQAFGYSGDEALKFTQAVLNVGAGVGADNERLSRMAYNLAQIRMVGKVTAVDMRQLAMAGFDLNSVLQYIGRQTGLNIQTYDDFNTALAQGKISWQQFTDYFQKYADENFGGASERMSRTLQGLKSTFSDLMVLTFPKILGPAAETFTGFANKVLDAFMSIRDSGILESAAQGLDKWMQGVVGKLSPFVDKVSTLITTLTGNFSEFEKRAAIANFIGPQNLGNILKLVDGFKKVVAAIRPFAEAIAKFIANNVKITDVLAAIGVVIAASVIPALLGAAAAFAPFLALVGLIALIRTAWEKNWLGIRDGLTQAWNTSILPALQQLWAWLQVNVPLAIQTLTNYWNTVLLPTLQSAWNWMQTSLIPAIQQLWAWLQINVPLAIQTLSRFWNSVLLPAIQRVWGWVQNSLIPTLSNLWAWLATNVPAAIQTLSNFWTGTLLPAITRAWDFFNANILPILNDVYDIANRLGTIVLTALAGFWENVLLPAITNVWQFFNDHVMPIFKDISSWIEEHLSPKVEGLGTKFQSLADTIEGGVKKALDWLHDKLEKIKDFLDNFKLPAWLTPGSPTPFEIGLRGINSVLQDLQNTIGPALAFDVSAVGGSRNVTAPQSGGVSGGDMYIEQNFYTDGAAAIGMSQVAQLRRKRLGVSMGG